MFMPKRNPTKMGSERMEDWKVRAKALFLVDRLNILQISELVGVSRKSVGNYLSSIPECQEEKIRRKTDNKAKRHEYQKEWDRRNRNTISSSITADTLRREHMQAVMELSHEKYH